MSLLLQILNEIEYDVVRKKIGNVNITFDVQATIHSDQQTKRFTITHVEINNDDIVAICQLALPRIIDLMLNNKVKANDNIIIRDRTTGLAAVIILANLDVNKLRLIVRTCMINSTFMPRNGEELIFVYSSNQIPIDRSVAYKKEADALEAHYADLRTKRQSNDTDLNNAA